MGLQMCARGGISLHGTDDEMLPGKCTYLAEIVEIGSVI